MLNLYETTTDAAVSVLLWILDILSLPTTLSSFHFLLACIKSVIVESYVYLHCQRPVIFPS